jgi:hypothetical protein
MPRRFTLAEAQGLIPRVDRLLREAIEFKNSYEEAEKQIQAFQERVTIMGGLTVDRDTAIQVRTQRDGAAAQLRNAIEQVQEVGCLIKDLDIGLIDFPTTYRGEEVYLCWKLGEDDIEHWHGIEEGFRGRKKIDRDFLDNHQGGDGE